MTKMERSGSGIEVEYSNGVKEEIENSIGIDAEDSGPATHEVV